MDAFGGLRGKTFALAVNRQKNIPRPGPVPMARGGQTKRHKNAGRGRGQIHSIRSLKAH